VDNRGEANLTRRAFGGSRVAVPSRPCSRRLRRRWRCASGRHRGAAVRCQIAPPPGLWGEPDRRAPPVDIVSGDVGPLWIVAMAGAELQPMTVPITRT
jgi:hypothetical protein